MEFRFIDTRDPLYGAERALRVEILRKPLGMPPGSELFPFEKESFHLVAVDEGRVVGSSRWPWQARGSVAASAGSSSARWKRGS